MAGNRRKAVAQRVAPPSCATCSLRAHTICRSLSFDKRQSDNFRPDKATLRRGEILVHEDDPMDTVTVVYQGLLFGYKMLADGRRQIVELFFPGDVMRDEAGRAAFTVEAATDTGVCRYPRSQLAKRSSNASALSRHLMQITERELFAAHELMLTLSRSAARARIAFLLLRLSAAAQARGERASPIWLPLSREAIGDHLGLTMETTSRVLSGFRRDGLIAQGGQDDWIELRDCRTLQELAGRNIDRLPEIA